MAEHTFTTVSPEEQWKPVVGYEGVYSVSSFGRVRRDKNWYKTRAGHIMKPSFGRKGYSKVHLTMDNRPRFHSVHKLVAEAFLGPRPPGHQINHKNSDKSNNCQANLEYTTYSENMRHAARSGTLGQAKLACDDVREIRKLLASGETQKKIAGLFRVSQTAIWNIKHNRAWGHFDNLNGQPIAAPRH